MNITRASDNVGAIDIIAQKTVKPTFDLNVDSVRLWDGGLSFVDRGEGGDRYGGELKFVGTIAEMENVKGFLRFHVYNDDEQYNPATNDLVITQFADEEKPFGAYVDHTQPVYASIVDVDGMNYRTNTTAEYVFKLVLKDFTPIVGTSVDFSHEVHGSRSVECFDELWSLVESQNRSANYNFSVKEPKNIYSAEYIFTDADVCGLITHLTTNRGLPLGGKNIDKIECVNRIGLKYWQYKIWWV